MLLVTPEAYAGEKRWATIASAKESVHVRAAHELTGDAPELVLR